MKKIFLAILLLTQISVQAQDGRLKGNFNVPISEEEGDLNNDGRIDKVVITMDTVDATVPLRLQIFLLNRVGDLN